VTRLDPTIVTDPPTGPSYRVSTATIASNFSTTSTTWVDTGLEVTLQGSTRLAVLLLQAQVWGSAGTAAPQLRFYNVTDSAVVGVQTNPGSIYTSTPGQQQVLIAALAAAGKTIRVQMQVAAGTGYLSATYTLLTVVEFS
jgi:hypothetical protein